MDNRGEFMIIPREDKIDPSKNSLAWQRCEQVQQTLSEIFPVRCKYDKCNPGDVVGAEVIRRLIDTPETRIGSSPEGSAKEQLEREASKAMIENSPIALVSIYGTPRHLDHPELNKAQLSDFAAVMMAQAALDRVYSVHDQGAFFHLVDENLTALWLDIAQHPDGKAGIEKFQGVYKGYLNDRLRMIKVLEEHGLINTGRTKIELLSETDIYGDIWKKIGSPRRNPEEDFITKCEISRPIFLNYLTISGDIFKKKYGPDDSLWQSSTENPELWDECQKEIMGTQEYKDLKISGWQGLIPPEMRTYYLNKFRQILGQPNLSADDQTLLFHVATYLSSTLEKYKAGVLTHGIADGTPIIKVPLTRPVDGRPQSHQALVPQRTLPEPQNKSLSKRISNCNRSAWGSLAVHSNSKLRLMETKEFLRIPEENIIPAEIYMIGPDRGKGSYLAETAFIIE